MASDAAARLIAALADAAFAGRSTHVAMAVATTIPAAGATLLWLTPP